MCTPTFFVAVNKNKINLLLSFNLLFRREESPSIHENMVFCKQLRRHFRIQINSCKNSVTHFVFSVPKSWILFHFIIYFCRCTFD